MGQGLRALGRVLGTALVLVGFVSVAACATIATHDEYRAYRRLRAANDEAERLRALADYAQRFPGGVWIAEVRRERTEREPAVWANGNATREGLQFYLAVYPDGQYVEQAQQRLAAVGMVEQRREEQRERVEEVQQARREQAAVERRLWVSRAVQFWARTLLAIRNFGQPIGAVARANPEFSRAFGQAPEPLCTPAGCIKHYHAHYAIPVPGATRIERQMHMFLRIRLASGRMERVEVLLPNKGFSRWYELENRTLVTDEDPAQRQAAIEWALQRIEPVIAEAAAGARPIDVIPEPIEPISEEQQAASERPEESDTAVPGEPAQPAQGAQPAEPSGEQAAGSAAAGSAAAGSAEGSIDALLEQAVGGGDAAEASAGVPAGEEPPADTSALVLPIGLRALQRGNLRIVVFAAGDEDYGEGYDGFYIERARD